MNFILSEKIDTIKYKFLQIIKKTFNLKKVDFYINCNNNENKIINFDYTIDYIINNKTFKLNYSIEINSSTLSLLLIKSLCSIFDYDNNIKIKTIEFSEIDNVKLINFKNYILENNNYVISYLKTNNLTNLINNKILIKYIKLEDITNIINKIIYKLNLNKDIKLKNIYNKKIGFSFDFNNEYNFNIIIKMYNSSNLIDTKIYNDSLKINYQIKTINNNEIVVSYENNYIYNKDDNQINKLYKNILNKLKIYFKDLK